MVSPDLVWLQEYFDTLTGLFNSLGLRNNSRKMVGMIYHPCRAPGNHPEAAYKRQMNGEGLTYLTINRLRVKLPDCGAGLVAWSL